MDYGKTISEAYEFEGDSIDLGTGVHDGQVVEAARLQQVAHIRRIEWAVLETGGQISVIPKQRS